MLDGCLSGQESGPFPVLSQTESFMAVELYAKISSVHAYNNRAMEMKKVLMVMLHNSHEDRH